MRLVVPLRPDELCALNDLAQRERRTPQQQAALLLGDALEQQTEGGAKFSKEKAASD